MLSLPWSTGRVRHPLARSSRSGLRRVKLIFAVVALAAAIWGIDQAGLWPDWAKTERVKRNPIHIQTVDD